MTYYTKPAAYAALMLLAGCGGSGDTVVTSLPPAVFNSAPSITSAASLDVAENSSGVIYTATASDADNDTVTFALLSTGDAALFSLDASSGALSFNAPPNFEFPDDANEDNVYELTLQGNDGAANSANFTLSITVTDVAEGFKTRRVATGLTQPLYAAALPDGTGRIVVAEKGGVIKIVDPEQTDAISAVDYLDVSATVSTNGERGLLGLVFSPDYANDRTLYLNVTNLSGDTEIRTYTAFDGELDRADPQSGNSILTIEQPRANHNAGWMGFDSAGFLVIPTGDGGGAGDPDGNAQDPFSLLGKVLRLDVSEDDFPADDLRDYAIPADNTYAGDSRAGLPEIFAIGLRNPFRASFDPATGDLLMGDVGQNAREEIDRLPMDDPTRNFGWNQVEGTQDFEGTDAPGFTAPVTEYSHGIGPREGRSIAGGYVYDGPIDALKGQYIFGDFVSDNVWSVPAADLADGSTLSSDNYVVRNEDFTPDAGSLNSISSFGVDAAKNLYILSIGGDIFRVEPE